MRFESIRKPRKCPACNSACVAVILYGMPDGSMELMKKVIEGRIFIGGCGITDDQSKTKIAIHFCSDHRTVLRIS